MTAVVDGQGIGRLLEHAADVDRGRPPFATALLSAEKLQLLQGLNC